LDNPVTFYSGKKMSDATLTIYNVFGQLLKQIIDVSENSLTLNRDNLPDGVYLFRISEGNNIILSGKLVISGD